MNKFEPPPHRPPANNRGTIESQTFGLHGQKITVVSYGTMSSEHYFKPTKSCFFNGWEYQKAVTIDTRHNCIAAPYHRHHLINPNLLLEKKKYEKVPQSSPSTTKTFRKALKAQKAVRTCTPHVRSQTQKDSRCVIKVKEECETSRPQYPLTEEGRVCGRRSSLLLHGYPSTFPEVVAAELATQSPDRLCF